MLDKKFTYIKTNYHWLKFCAKVKLKQQKSASISSETILTSQQMHLMSITCLAKQNLKPKTAHGC